MWNQPMLRIHHNEGTGAMRRSTSMWLTQSGTVMFSVPPLRRSTMSKANPPARMICIISRLLLERSFAADASTRLFVLADVLEHVLELLRVDHLLQVRDLVLGAVAAPC